MSARIRRLSNGVGRRHPVTTQSVSLIAVDDVGVYIATPDRCTVLCCWVHKGQGSCLKNSCTSIPSWSGKPPHKGYAWSYFPSSDSRCRWYVSDLSSFTPKYVGSWVKDRHFPSSVMLSLWHASLLFRWKATITIFEKLSFSHQVCKYAASVTRSWLRAPSMARQSPAECIMQDCLHMHISARLMSASHRCRCYIEEGPRLIPVKHLF